MEEEVSIGKSKVGELPVYSSSEVAKHTSRETGIWVTHNGHVYDVTKFVANHPGGEEKIMLAAGSSVEPYWRLYPQHGKSKMLGEVLDRLRIGILDPEDVAREEAAKKARSLVQEDDLFKADPELSPLLKYHSSKPTNAEAPGKLLGDAWITPQELWFVRNHHPVPTIAESDYVLSIGGLGVQSDKSNEKGEARVVLKLSDLKSKFKRHTVVSSLQCGGNRRAEMNQVAVTSGSPWNVSAISTAEWSGARLSDVLRSLGIADRAEELGIEHVQFAAAEGMEASIPITKALFERGDVLLAYEMNGAPIPAQHGFPVRLIVPGHVGVRNVKWLTHITLSNQEAKGPWQRSMAYKGFGPSTKSLEGIEVEKIPSLQEQPVQSAITSVVNGSTVYRDSITTLSGYAYSGGGRGIVRVDVSADGGKTWQTATLKEGSSQRLDRAWAWTLWEADVNIPASLPKEITHLELICKATDASYNVQPDTVAGIWNLRGINNNAWHRVVVRVADQPVEEEE